MNNKIRKKSSNNIGGSVEKVVAACFSCKDIDEKLPNAEALVDVIARRSYNIEPAASPSKTAEGLRNLRKVSDADIDNATSVAPHSDDSIKHLAATYEYGCNEISRFYDIRSRSMIAKKTPAFLEVSIASEFVLRDMAREITRNLVESFHDETWRIYLGYKSSALKRDRLLAVLAEILFDVSYAMIAWKQTEEELQSQRLTNSKLDQRILSTLFDSRALRKIGGFHDSSLLPHALSICRLAKKGVSWEDFAETEKGEALLQHHVDGKAMLAGQKRRDARVRTRKVVSSSNNCETRRRSRSSSISSYGTMEHKRDGAHVTIGDQSRVEFWGEGQQASLMPDALPVSMRKPASESWGVLLAKEGDVCVVVRAPEAASSEGQVQQGFLKVGDVVLAVGTEREESAEEETRDWFRFVVNKFKASDEVDLVIRRVWCILHPTVMSDDGSLGIIRPRTLAS